MNVTQKVTLDLVRRGLDPTVYAIQGDSLSRVLAVELLANGIPWEIPAEAAVLIRYRKPDGTGGTYDTLPDGTRAWSAAENLLTVTLAPQVCTAAGTVEMELTLLMEPAQLTTFRLELRVSGQLPDGAHSQNYVNLAAWLSDHGANGIDVTDAAVNGNGHLLVTLSDGKVLDAGRVTGETGPSLPCLWARWKHCGRIPPLPSPSPAPRKLRC